ncbi:hypothetical protein U1Q18_009107 [Sarracenia purpurea var. burkii]
MSMAEVEALRDEDMEKEDEEDQDECGGGGFVVAHPVGDGNEEGGEDELHREVAVGADEIVGREAVHAGGAFFEQYQTLLREGEDGVKEREKAQKIEKNNRFLLYQ